MAAGVEGESERHRVRHGDSRGLDLPADQQPGDRLGCPGGEGRAGGAGVVAFGEGLDGGAEWEMAR